MRQSDITLGMRVVVDGLVARAGGQCRRAHGTVRSTTRHYADVPIGVEFDVAQEQGHNLNGEISSRRGLWVQPEIIEPLDHAEIVSEAVAGRDYVIVDIGMNDAFYPRRNQYIGQVARCFSPSIVPARDGFLGCVLSVVHPDCGPSDSTFLQVKLAEATAMKSTGAASPLYLSLRSCGLDSRPEVPESALSTYGDLLKYVMNNVDDVYPATDSEYSQLETIAKAIMDRIHGDSSTLSSFMDELP